MTSSSVRHGLRTTLRSSSHSMETSKPQNSITPKTTHTQVSGLLFCPSHFRDLLHQMTITLQSQKFSHLQHSFYPNIHIFTCYLHFYYSTGICNKWKNSKTSKKHYIILLLKNHCFYHFFTFLQFYQDHLISQKHKKHYFHYFPCGGGNAIFLIFT